MKYYRYNKTEIETWNIVYGIYEPDCIWHNLNIEPVDFKTNYIGDMRKDFKEFFVAQENEGTTDRNVKKIGFKTEEELAFFILKFT